jgi:hypothetical protein
VGPITIMLKIKIMIMTNSLKVEEWADMELVWAFLYKEELMVKSEEVR